jgi:hypothetical protein
MNPGRRRQRPVTAHQLPGLRARPTTTSTHALHPDVDRLRLRGYHSWLRLDRRNSACWSAPSRSSASMRERMNTRRRPSLRLGMMPCRASRRRSMPGRTRSGAGHRRCPCSPVRRRPLRRSVSPFYVAPAHERLVAEALTQGAAAAERRRSPARRRLRTVSLGEPPRSCAATAIEVCCHAAATIMAQRGTDRHRWSDRRVAQSCYLCGR